MLQNDSQPQKQHRPTVISLRIKLLLGFTLVFNIVFAGAYYWFYTYATERAVQRIRDDLVDTLTGAIAGMDGDQFAILATIPVPQGQTVPADNTLYQQHQAWLRVINTLEPRSIPYTFVKGTQPYEILWIGDILRITRPESSTAYRESYMAPPADTNLYKGFTELTVTLTPYTDKWGEWISAYAPIKDRKGQVVGGMGLDFQANYISQVQAGIRNSIVASFLITYISLLGLIYLLAEFLTKPISRLTEAVQHISDGVYNQSLIPVAHGRWRDEIHTLSEGFAMMIGQIRHREEILERYSHTLEQKVEQRTQEIQEKNNQLEETLHDLKRTQAQLIQSEKMSSLGQLVAGMAHEINNPLNFIYSNTVYIEEQTHQLLSLVQMYHQQYPETRPEIQAAFDELGLDFLQDDLPRAIASVRNGTERIRQIVLSLRLFSRLDEAEIKAVNVHDGINSTLMLLNHRLRTAPDVPDIQVMQQYGELPLVECYAGQLNQVFLNILNNAIDAVEAALEQGAYGSTTSGVAPGTTGSEQETLCSAFCPGEPDSPIPAGSVGNPGAQGDRLTPTIWIRTEVLSEQRIAIHIKDNGIGMSDTVRHRAFEPFFTTKVVGRGTGMGLSISYQIVTEKHSGSLRCLSSPETGTEMTIELPIHQAGFYRQGNQGYLRKSG